MIKQRLNHYAQLLRLDKPAGTLLLLWPTLWGLWLAGDGQPQGSILIIFLTGTFIMRSAGCVMNDIADRKFDRFVNRTTQRPLANGAITLVEAFVILGVLLSIALVLVLQLNRFTLLLACIAVAITASYPFMKRITHWPQLVLAVAFTWGIPMAFAAQTGRLGFHAFLLFGCALIWPLIYDTFYAMADRDDDILIGIKSTAILFGNNDKFYLALMQACFISGLLLLGFVFQLKHWYYWSVLIVVGLSLHQQYLIRHRQSEQCYQAFLKSHWCGLVIFLGIVLSYLP